MQSSPHVPTQENPRVQWCSKGPVAQQVPSMEKKSYMRGYNQYKLKLHFQTCSCKREVSPALQLSEGQKLSCTGP